MILITLAIVGVGVILLSLTFHILFLVFMFGVVVSSAQSGPGLSNTAALMSRWFKRRRGTAISVNSAALSLGGLIMVPFSMYLLQATNWHIAWIALGALVLATLPMAYFFLRERPEDMGLFPDGDPDPAETGAAKSRRGGTGPLEVTNWKDAFRSSPIWQLSGSYLDAG